MARQGRWIEVEGWGWRGRVWQATTGKRTYYVRKMVAGHLYEKSTRCTSLAAALKEHERFEADPAGYQPMGAGPAVVAIYLDKPLGAKFLEHSRDVKNNSLAWVRMQRAILDWWQDRLQGADLRDRRGVLLRERILPALEGNPRAMRNARIRVLKRLYSWLRVDTHLITAQEDPTLDVLSAEPTAPAQVDKSKVIPREHYLRLRDALTAPWRDVVILQAGTGVHITEAHRFAAAGTTEPLPPSMRVENGAVGVVVIPLHKNGAPHRVAVSQEVLDAADRLRQRGSFSVEHYRRAIKKACHALAIPEVKPGSFRHSVATWAIERGADVAAVSTFLGHKSPATTKRFYSTLATAVKIPTLA